MTDISPQITLYVVGTPLKNPKHEQFVQAFPKHSSAVKAYQATYPSASYGSARASACDILSRPEVKNRLLEVFQEKGIDEDFIAQGLYDLTKASKENVRLGSFRTILEVRRDIDSASKIGIQVNTGDIPAYEQRLAILEKYARRQAKP